MPGMRRHSICILFVILLCFIGIICLETVENSGDQRRITSLIGDQKHKPVKRQVTEANDKDDFLKIPEIPKKKLSSKLKYKPFDVPEGYNNLQIPSASFVAASMKGFPSEEFGMFDAIAKDIAVTIRIIDISTVNEQSQEITFAADLIVQWTDEVISLYTLYSHNLTNENFGPGETDHLVRTLDPAVLHKIWKPDIYMEDLIRVRHPEIMSQPVTIRLNEITGQFTYVSRLRIQMECGMAFYYYPADTQICKVVIRSNSHASDELNLRWAEPSGAFLIDCGGPNFDFQLTDIDDMDREEGYIGTQTRHFSVLTFAIAARRKLSYHMVQTYLPSIFFIIITWLCFLVPARMVEARCGIAMTTLLTLTAMFASVRESTPPVSYVRAIDIWMIACVFFVFLTLLEFTVLLWLRNIKEEIEAEEAKHSEAEAKKENLNHEGTTAAEKLHVTYSQLRRLRRRRKAELYTKISIFIEKFAFLIFSCVFAVFSVIYWSWLLYGSGYFEWTVDKNVNKCQTR